MFTGKQGVFLTDYQDGQVKPCPDGFRDWDSSAQEFPS